MKNKKPGSVFIWIFAAFALFLAVPFISQEETSSSKSGNLFIDDDGALPIVGSENPLAKYFNKVAEFYGFKKKSSSNRRNSLALNDSSDSREDEALASELSALFAASDKIDFINKVPIPLRRMELSKTPILLMR